MKMTLEVTHQQIQEQITTPFKFKWNGRTYVYREKNTRLLTYEEVGGLMNKRVMAVKRNTRKGFPFPATVVGAMEYSYNGYKSIVYLVAKDDGPIVQAGKVFTE